MKYGNIGVIFENIGCGNFQTADYNVYLNLISGTTKPLERLMFVSSREGAKLVFPLWCLPAGKQVSVTPVGLTDHQPSARLCCVFLYFFFLNVLCRPSRSIIINLSSVISTTS
jgi:hypothetical protein